MSLILRSMKIEPDDCILRASFKVLIPFQENRGVKIIHYDNFANFFATSENDLTVHERGGLSGILIEKLSEDAEPPKEQPKTPGCNALKTKTEMKHIQRSVLYILTEFGRWMEPWTADILKWKVLRILENPAQARFPEERSQDKVNVQMESMQDKILSISINKVPKPRTETRWTSTVENINLNGCALGFVPRKRLLVKKDKCQASRDQNKSSAEMLGGIHAGKSQRKVDHCLYLLLLLMGVSVVNHRAMMQLMKITVKKFPKLQQIQDARWRKKYVKNVEQLPREDKRSPPSITSLCPPGILQVVRFVKGFKKFLWALEEQKIEQVPCFKGVHYIPAALKLFEAKMLVQFLYEAQLNPGVNYEKLQRVQTSFLRKYSKGHLMLPYIFKQNSQSSKQGHVYGCSDTSEKLIFSLMYWNYSNKEGKRSFGILETSTDEGESCRSMRNNEIQQYNEYKEIHRQSRLKDPNQVILIRAKDNFLVWGTTARSHDILGEPNAFQPSETFQALGGITSAHLLAAERVKAVKNYLQPKEDEIEIISFKFGAKCCKPNLPDFTSHCLHSIPYGKSTIMTTSLGIQLNHLPLLLPLVDIHGKEVKKREKLAMSINDYCRMMTM
ncbi:hypothetical protein L345_04427, partial [Ophiophagus hannah]